MIVASVARRYARALLSLGLDEGRHEQYGEELEAVQRALSAAREAAVLLGNPRSTPQERHAAVNALASVLDLAPAVASFLRLLVDRGRIGDLPAVVRAYRTMLDQQAGRVRATVTSAQPLAGGDLDRLREAIAGVTRREIILEARTDPEIIGGLVTQVGATMLDGSLRTQLERLREQLKRAPV